MLYVYNIKKYQLYYVIFIKISIIYSDNSFFVFMCAQFDNILR